jgi:hypothetical protein
MTKKNPFKKFFNVLFGQHPNANFDGTITTKHGNRIIPHKVSASGANGGLKSNIAEFMSQPRRIEISKQLESIDWSTGDKPSLDLNTGCFYSAKDLEKNGLENATPLGQIDVDLEKRIFRLAAEKNKMRYLFGDASYKNPIVLDEATGRVYPKNNPEQTRGHVNLGPKVEGPAAYKDDQKKPPSGGDGSILTATILGASFASGNSKDCSNNNDSHDKSNDYGDCDIDAPDLDL